MAQVGRLGGAILAASQGRYFLVGDLKEPVDFPAAGFTPPAAIGGAAVPFVELTPLGPAVALKAPLLSVDLEGPDLADKLASCFVIRRNGSVSERLWRLVTESSPAAPDGGADARWLGVVPEEVWEAVRDSVLRC